MKIIKQLVKLSLIGGLGILSIFMFWAIGGVIYWTHVFPTEKSIFSPSRPPDIFAKLRWENKDKTSEVLYSERISPLIIYGLGLPTEYCSSKMLRQGRLNLANSLVRYLRSEGCDVGYCRGNKRQCWLVDSIFSSIALRLKYRPKALKELYLILFDFKSADKKFQEILGHSIQEVTPEEAAIISRWFDSPINLENGPESVKLIKNEARKIATNCGKRYMPVPDSAVADILSKLNSHEPK